MLGAVQHSTIIGPDPFQFLSPVFIDLSVKSAGFDENRSYFKNWTWPDFAETDEFVNLGVIVFPIQQERIISLLCSFVLRSGRPPRGRM
jgi:hypothetical protein